MNEGIPVVVVGDNSDAIATILEWGRQAMLNHPEATRAAFRALIEEGRRSAKTPEGKAEAERLAQSSLVQRARFSWDLTSLWLTDTEEGPVPSNFVDGLMMLADHSQMEEILQRLNESPLDLGNGN